MREGEERENCLRYLKSSIGLYVTSVVKESACHIARTKSGNARKDKRANGCSVGRAFPLVLTNSSQQQEDLNRDALENTCRHGLDLPRDLLGDGRHLVVVVAAAADHESQLQGDASSSSARYRRAEVIMQNFFPLISFARMEYQVFLRLFLLIAASSSPSLRRGERKREPSFPLQPRLPYKASGKHHSSELWIESNGFVWRRPSAVAALNILHLCAST